MGATSCQKFARGGASARGFNKDAAQRRFAKNRTLRATSRESGWHVRGEPRCSPPQKAAGPPRQHHIIVYHFLPTAMVASDSLWACRNCAKVNRPHIQPLIIIAMLRTQSRLASKGPSRDLAMGAARSAKAFGATSCQKFARGGASARGSNKGAAPRRFLSCTYVGLLVDLHGDLDWALYRIAIGRLLHFYWTCTCLRTRPSIGLLLDLY